MDASDQNRLNIPFFGRLNDTQTNNKRTHNILVYNARIEISSTRERAGARFD